MVNFGGHLSAFQLEENKGTNLFVVAYNEVKKLTQDREAFIEAWNENLRRASDDFQLAMGRLWETIFEGIHGDEALYIRGMPSGSAWSLYVHQKGVEASQVLLIELTHIHSAALNNAEGLRKLVKKYDKHNENERSLSVRLLPILYSSNFFLGQSSVLDQMTMLRTMLQIVTTETKVVSDTEQDSMEDDPEDHAFIPVMRNNSEADHVQSIQRRMTELAWLKRLVCSIPDQHLQRLVSHRGFHHVQDRNDRRPLENSQSAYETAWTSGIHLCECDIALTKDQRIVLAHDEHFRRLALDEAHMNSSKNVGDLTFAELISMPLKSGIRPPLLIDILRSAQAISGNAKLIIELKPGNGAAVSALARMLSRHTDLMQRIAMIMSFDAVCMHRLRSELIGSGLIPSVSNPFLTSHSRQNSLVGMSLSAHRTLGSLDHFGWVDSSNVGLDLSHGNLHAIEETSSIPKLMLLTVSDPPNIPCELQVGIEDLSPIDGWLASDSGSLDGVYLQYQESMMTAEGAASLRQLGEKYAVGVWGYSGKDPDDYATFRWLVEEGNVTYVNTDLPTHFKPDVLVHSETQ